MKTWQAHWTVQSRRTTAWLAWHQTPSHQTARCWAAQSPQAARLRIRRPPALPARQTSTVPHQRVSTRPESAGRTHRLRTGSSGPAAAAAGRTGTVHLRRHSPGCWRQILRHVTKFKRVITSSASCGPSEARAKSGNQKGIVFASSSTAFPRAPRTRATKPERHARCYLAYMIL